MLLKGAHQQAAAYGPYTPLLIVAGIVVFVLVSRLIERQQGNRRTKKGQAIS